MHAWDSDLTLLYALAVGAGGEDPLTELEFTTENSVDRAQRALPTMATIIAHASPYAYSTFLENMKTLGVADLTDLLHVGQGLELPEELPIDGEVATTTEITGIHDLGRSALVSTTTTATLATSGQVIFRDHWTGLVRDGGGWEGDRPPRETQEPPRRPADHRVVLSTAPNQALLYRLCGARNPLHSDPTAAARNGMARPILHGLCTFGFTGRALLGALCGGDPSRLRAMSGRFTASVVPGTTLLVDIWRRADGKARFRTVVDDVGVVIDHGHVAFDPGDPAQLG